MLSRVRRRRWRPWGSILGVRSAAIKGFVLCGRVPPVPFTLHFEPVAPLRIFRLMKRALAIWTCSLFAAVPLLAQTAPEVEEKLERHTRDIEALIAANAELQRRVTALSAEVDRLREQQARAANNTAIEGVRDDLRKLAEKVQEVDRKRVNDMKEVTTQFDKLEQAIKTAAKSAAPSRPTPAPAPEPTPRVQGPGLEYVVKPGDTLSVILTQANARFRADGLRNSVTQQQVVEANPGLDPNRIRTGQKIFIPQPEK